MAEVLLRDQTLVYENPLYEFSAIQTGMMLDQVSKEALAHVYITQHIRREGVLSQDCLLYSQQLSLLEAEKYVISSNWYRHHVLSVTPVGKSIAAKEVERNLDLGTEAIKRKLDQIPRRIAAFIIRESFLKLREGELAYPIDFQGLSDYLDLPYSIYNCIIRRGLTTDLQQILSAFEEASCVKRARNYVSTRGGELRENCWVLSPEVLDFLRAYQSDLHIEGLPAELEKRHRMYHLLREHRITENLFSTYGNGIMSAAEWLALLAKLLGLKLLEQTSWGYAPVNRLAFDAYIEEEYLSPIEEYLKRRESKKFADGFEISLSKPYQNLRKISELLFRLEGEVRILDKHFSEEALPLLLELNVKNIKLIHLLTSEDRLGSKFNNHFKAFKNEMKNLDVEVELRILDDKDSRAIHARYIMDSHDAFHIPPLNVITTQMDDVLPVDNSTKVGQFERFWARAKPH